jgi:N,N'-diacetylchitobiose transport system permease protein
VSPVNDRTESAETGGEVPATGVGAPEAGVEKAASAGSAPARADRRSHGSRPVPAPASAPGSVTAPEAAPAGRTREASAEARAGQGGDSPGGPSAEDARGKRSGPADPRRAGPGRSPRAGGWTPWLYLAPALVVLGGLLVYPIWQLGLISFFQYTQAQVSGGEPATFEGFGNYAELFGDPQFWQVLLATVLFATACVVSTLAVGCALAVLLTRVRAVPRLALLLAALGAWATPAVTGSTVWLFLFDPDFGPVNRMLGLGDHSWTYGRISAFFLVLLEVVWCSFPFVMVTVYAGIRAVPGEVLEAASLDGASQWRIWRSVLAPMLRPILVVVTIQSVIWDFKVFTQIYVMTNGGGIAGQNLVLNVYAYQQAFASSQYGLGSAIGVVMLLILLAVTLMYLRLLRRQGEEV